MKWFRRFGCRGGGIGVFGVVVAVLLQVGYCFVVVVDG